MTTDSNTIEELVGRVEAATGPDEHIDCLVWQIASPDQRVMFDGGKAFGPGPKRPATYGRLADFPLDNWTDWHAVRMLIDAPPVTASIDAALALAERLLPEWTVQVFQLRRNKGWGARVSSPRYDTYSSFEDDEHATDDGFTGQANGALALLVAILKALRSLTKLEG